MISEKIKKQNKSLEKRGLKEDSFFVVHFKDDSFVSEKDANWNEMGEVKVCDYFGGKKTVCICTHPVKKIHIKHEGMEHILEVPKDCYVYQANRSETLFLQNGEKKERLLGRVIGLVKDNEIIEEYFLNGIEGRIFGNKK